MDEKKPTPDFQKKAVKKYLSKFADMKIRVEPQWRETVQSHAKDMGESTSAFMKRAIEETMERDKSNM